MNEDNELSFNKRKNLQIRKEVEAFESDPLRKAQAQLDGSVQLHRDLQTIERGLDRRGDYSPIKRFEAEMDEAQVRADARRR
jgi:hypothetical protein